MSVITMEPALINGFRGIPFSTSSCTSELKAVPEGSLPTLFHRLSPSRLRHMARENTFEILCMEKPVVASPCMKVSPCMV